MNRLTSLPTLVWRSLRFAVRLALGGPELRHAFAPHVHAMAVEVTHSWHRRQSLKRLPALLAEADAVRLDIGSGPVRRDGWLSLDLDPAAHLQLDLTRRLPFADASVDEIHSEHFFEHLAYPAQIMPVLHECHRVLKPGAVISFSVPNMRPFLEAYVRRDLDEIKERIAEDMPASGYDRTAMDAVAWFALREGEHQFLFDDENAAQRLTDAGFEGAHVRAFDEARDYHFRRSSVYVEARKPA